MFDYTDKGIAARQGDLAVAYLDLIDTKLAKINRKLAIVTLIAVGAVIFKNKDKLIALNNMKGE